MPNKRAAANPANRTGSSKRAKQTPDIFEIMFGPPIPGVYVPQTVDRVDPRVIVTTSFPLSPTSYYKHGGIPPSIQLDVQQLMKLKPDHPGTVMMMGRPVLTPRFTANYLRPYQFSGVVHPTQPLPEILEPLLTWANENIAGPLKFNQVLVNFYMDGTQYIGKHSDDEKQLVAGSPIFSASFGQERKFRVRSKATGEIKNEIMLEDRTYIVMGGDMQKEFYHEVPKVSGNKGKAMGPRVNVTFRVFK